MDNYIVLASYRDDEGKVVRYEGKGTYNECLTALQELSGKKVISVEISHIIATVTTKR